MASPAAAALRGLVRPLVRAQDEQQLRERRSAMDAAPRPALHQPCAVCGAESLFRCGGCRIRHYCSKEHQIQDWKASHRANCKPYLIETSATLGRCLVATRDLSPGSLIIAEEPLVVSPKQWTPPVCLGCFTAVHAESPRCVDCGWPVCRLECGLAAGHQAECHYTRGRRTPDNTHRKVAIRDFSFCHPLYHSVSLLRCLFLRDKKIKIWKKFINLTSHEKARSQRLEDGEDDDVDKVVKFTISFFCLKESDAEDLKKIYGILLVNGHEVPASTTEGGPTFLAIYDNASMLEHNCVPNCTKRFSQSGGIEVRTTTMVEKGSRLSISYTDPLWGTVDRRKHLSLSKYFFCACERCEDPTELGTFIGALKCRSCKHGYCVPVSTRGSSSGDIEMLSSYEWVCFGKPVAEASRDTGCGTRVEFEAAMAILEPIGRKLSHLQPGNLSDTQHFLRTYSGIMLHRNHHFMTEARLGLMKALQQKLSGTDEALSLKESPETKLLEITCHELLDVVEKICPGMTEIRGILLYELNAKYLTRVLYEKVSPLYAKDIQEERIKRFREAVASLTHCGGTRISAFMASRGRQLLACVDDLRGDSSAAQEDAEREC